MTIIIRSHLVWSISLKRTSTLPHLHLAKISILAFQVLELCTQHKVSVQGVVALGGHFATLCREVGFYEATFFFIINFQKEKANTFTLSIILIVKSLPI